MPPLESPEDYTSRRFAEVIVDFMDSLDIRQANLVATDIALLPSLLVGLEHPSRVMNLVVMDFFFSGLMACKVVVDLFLGVSEVIS